MKANRAATAIDTFYESIREMTINEFVVGIQIYGSDKFNSMLHTMVMLYNTTMPEEKKLFLETGVFARRSDADD